MEMLLSGSSELALSQVTYSSVNDEARLEIMGYSDVEPQNMTVDLNSPVAGTSMSLDDEFDEQLASRPHASAPASATTPATRPKRLIMVVFFIWFEPFLSLHRHSSDAGTPAFKRKRTTKHAKTDPHTHEGTVHLCQMQNGAAHAAIQKAELCETVQNSISALTAIIVSSEKNKSNAIFGERPNS